ncbi:MAG: hypothetical protein QXL78_02475 [Methanocellales archaeon]
MVERLKLPPAEVYKKAALAWMYGVAYGIRSFPGTQWNLLSNAGDFWLAFQKSSSGIEVKRGKPFEAARGYLEDCKSAGFNDQRDTISGDDEEIKISIHSCFYRPICLHLLENSLPIICPRLGLFENVILKGSDEVYTYSVSTGEKLCSGTIKPLKLP